MGARKLAVPSEVEETARLRRQFAGETDLSFETSGEENEDGSNGEW
jgi:hypothetical protein